MNDRPWRILLVDDDPDDYVLTRALFVETKGQSIVLEWAKTYEEAIASLDAGFYDAILVDYDLGSRNGVEFVRETQARGLQMPVILLTGRGNYEVDLEAMQAGAADYLSKSGVTAPLLERTVRYAIERKQAELALRRVHEELEQRVRERTQELQWMNEQLAEANEQLQAENEERVRVEALLRESNTALQENEARFRTIFQESALGIALKDLDGRILAGNPALQEMLGYSDQELRRMRFSDLTHPGDVVEEKVLFSRLSAGAIHRYRLEKRYLHKDGSLVWARVAVSVVQDELGKPLFAIFLVENITEWKRIEAELEEVRRRLVDSREIERLELARELHDGPMQELYAIAYQMTDLQELITNTGPDLDHGNGNGSAVEQLENAQKRIFETIQELRAFSMELRPPTLTPFGLERTIQSHAETFQEQHPEFELLLELQPDGQQLPERVRLALYRIYQVALANVLRHARASQAHVRFHFDAEQAYLEVQDNGVGFTVSTWIELVREGHLGLAGAAERAEALGGGMEVESEPGRGTRVRAVIPWTDEQVRQPAGA